MGDPARPHFFNSVLKEEQRIVDYHKATLQPRQHHVEQQHIATVSTLRFYWS